MSGVGLLTLVLCVVLIGLLALCVYRANRLDRLHVRTDAARAALLAALERRAVVARAVAAHTGDESLRRAAADAEAAPLPQRETAENRLGRLVGGLNRASLPAALVLELDDAEQRVMLARRVHNDAVRDTLRLRARRLVRWFRLAGPTPLPEYFEIADTAGDEPPRRRSVARVVLLDHTHRVLLCEAVDSEVPDRRCWITPGRSAGPGEDLRSAAARELAEQTGLRLEPDSLIGPVWQRAAMLPSAGRMVVADEHFFLAAMNGATNGTRLEAPGVPDAATHRWWSVAELSETSAVILPAQLAELLLQMNGTVWDGRTLQVR